MADQKISQCPEVTDIEGNEELVLAINGRNYRIKASVFLAAIATYEIDKASLGLDQVDNTSDANKPISISMQEALADKANEEHQHVISNIADLQTLLDEKATIEDLANKTDAGHGHVVDDVAGLVSVLNEKANAEDLASKADSAQLATKADAVHTHSISDIVDLETTLSTKADSSDLVNKADAVHNHEISNVNGLQTVLDEKANVTDLATKANTAHTHAYSHLSDLADFLSLITEAQRPSFEANVNAIDYNQVNVTINYAPINGYNMAAITINVRYKKSTDTEWLSTGVFQFANGTLTYHQALTNLEPATQYDYSVISLDGNNPTYNWEFSDIFTTSPAV